MLAASSNTSFNPRAREGATIKDQILQDFLRVSIHAPVKARPYYYNFLILKEQMLFFR